ncbi:MAG: hypothetical protein ACI9XK_004013 [Granulosicoccus sp.]|jgi:hypothetical protein
MWTAHSQYQQLGNTTRVRQIDCWRLFEDELNDTLIHDIKQCQKTGFVLGTENFRHDFEKLTGQPQSRQKRSPKTKPQM